MGIVGKIINSLSKNEIAIRMLNQGASKISMMLGVESKDAEKAVTSIYKEFFNEVK